MATYRVPINTSVFEREFSACIYPDVDYYYIRLVRANGGSKRIAWAFDDVPRRVERFAILSRKNKHLCYIKLFGVAFSLPPTDVFETLSDAIAAADMRNYASGHVSLLDDQDNVSDFIVANTRPLSSYGVAARAAPPVK